MRADATIAALRNSGLTAAVAESLTGGQICEALTEVPGSSEVFLGGVVTYTVATKRRLLGVSADLLAEAGPVDPRVAVQMAQRVVKAAGADVGVSTTGVAGPQPHGGQGPGLAYIGWRCARGQGAIEVHVPGDRATVRSVVTAAALEVLTQCAGTGTVEVDRLSVPATRVDGEWPAAPRR